MKKSTMKPRWEWRIYQKSYLNEVFEKAKNNPLLELGVYVERNKHFM